jgi:hypothetical protein
MDAYQHTKSRIFFLKFLNSEKICAVASCPCKLPTQDRRLEEEATKIENWGAREVH